ncbi:MAG: ABC transporter substrate-binding protein [Demequina sp.]|uniref:ABC transporter substrate-binding protein n=1 Tax=Demequina sp. TaxID=2050685 RepID=UPI003A89C286
MRKPALVAALATTAFALTACTTASQDVEASADPSASTSAAAGFDLAAIEVNEEAAALLPADIVESGVLRVGMETTYAPAEFLDADGQTPIGYDVDLSNAIAASLGLEAEVSTAAFDSIIPGIGSKYDAGISSFTITPERLEVVDMTQYFTAGSSLAVQTGNPAGIDTANLCGTTIAVQTGTIQESEAGEMSAACEADGADAIEVLSYDSNADAATNVVGGKADALFADSPVAGYAVSQAGGQLELVGDALDAAPQGIVTAQGSDLTVAIAAALQGLMDDGTLEEILAAWGTESGALTAAEVNPAS